jgi:acyl carrier protein
MVMEIQRTEILHYLVNSLFLDRLELADAGYGPDDFSEETMILSKDGLGLDSVDVLDLLVGIEKKYQLKPIEIDAGFIEGECASISSVIDMVQARMKAAN